MNMWCFSHGLRIHLVSTFELESIHGCENLVSLFNNKLFYAEAKHTRATLGRTRHFLREDLDAYLRSFHERVLNCCDPMIKYILRDVCLHCMMEECRVHLENLSFASFSIVMEAEKGTNE